MTGRWVKSLPDVSGAPIEDRRLSSVRYAAAYVRALPRRGGPVMAEYACLVCLPGRPCPDCRDEADE